MRESCAILDFGSSSVVAMIGENGVNNTFNILGRGEIAYAGFQDAEFLEPENLKFAIATALSNAEMTSDTKITEIYIGVPGEFCSCVTKSIKLSFPKAKKISKFDVDNIYKTGDAFDEDKDYTLINHSVIYYELDSTKRVIDPVALKAKTLVGNISYILAKADFVTQITKIFSELRITIKGYICAMLAESLYLFEPEVRDKYVLIADVGYITTSIALARGNALLFLNSFSLGGGYITADLSQCLKISFNEAERLKHKVVLGWEPKPSDVYEIEGDEYKNTFAAKATNEIVSDRVEMICEYIEKCLDRCMYDLPEFVPLYIVGGGFNFLRGVKSIVSRKLKRQVEFVSSVGMKELRPYDASEEGMLNIILNYSDMLESVLVKNK